MRLLPYLLPSAAVILGLASAQLQTSTQKLFSCSVTKYQDALYKKDKLLGENRWYIANSFDVCGEQCLLHTGCKAVNFMVIGKQGYCAPLDSGLPNAKAAKTLYDNYRGAIHAVITCRKRTSSGPVGCGRQAPAHMPSLKKNLRIIGGSDAKPHSWPWLVLMGIDYKNGLGGRCGASLLRVKNGVEKSDIVLTAAHCVTEEASMGTKPKAFAPDQLSFIAGEHRIDKYDDGQESRKGAAIRFHPSFKFTPKNGAVNDLALVKLASPVDFTNTIRPICLAQVGEAIPEKKTCVTAGWGRNNSKNNGLPMILQQALSPAHNGTTCRKGWGSVYQEAIHICSGSLTGKSGACEGDSGGMLACQQTDGSWRLYGASSFGVQGTCLEAGKPSMYTRLSNFIGWITKYMNQMTSIK